ncbi:Protein AIR2 [Pseudocercospora fuligena]|uniref:Protein AIR2 n=1 Tax=Pseudocercospora fuligena TaxID=685502 RepID=A0A8H6RBQ9_9PEZI|nr:Protein AIR2 [Pseudocercospora fuligena]
MSDSENESRTNAVGRKRNVHGEFKTPSYPTSRRSSKASSKESGEISSSSGSESEEDDEPNKRTRHSPNAAITISDNSGSDDGEVSSSQASSSSMDTSSSDDSDSDSDSGSSNLSHGISKMAAEADDLVRLYSLSKEDRDLQKRYFNLTSPPDALVYCLCCGERGHMRTTCPSRKCSHCGAYDSHASSACPTYRKCALCRQRGHDAKACKNRSYQGQSDQCDVCGEAGHVEEACSRLWCFPTIAATVPREKQIREWEMIKACYSCGSSEHWGDDCRYIRRDDLNPVRTWSEKNAERFILRGGPVDHDPQLANGDDEEDDDPLAALESGLKEGDGEYVEAEDSEEEYEPPPPPPSRPWQMGLFDDARD